MNRKHLTLYYCARCRMTTPHEAAGSDFTCGRCGSVKSAPEAGTSRAKSALPFSKSADVVDAMRVQADDRGRSSEVYWN